LKTIFITIVCTVLLFSVINSKESNYISSILAKYPANSNEALILVFLDYGSCVKCYNYPTELIEQTKEKGINNFKLIAFVYCNRAKEVKDFGKKVNWKYNFEPDINDASREKLGCDYENDMFIMNNKGEIIEKISYKDGTDNNLEKISKALIKLK
jgi:hypothetical protein